MKKQEKHTPTPYKVIGGEGTCRIVATLYDNPYDVAINITPEDAAFIVRACNAHDKLVEALGVIARRLTGARGNDTRLKRIHAVAVDALKRVKVG